MLGLCSRPQEQSKSLISKIEMTLGKGGITIASEPYYYDSAYHPVKGPSSVPIKENITCVVAIEISNSENDSTKTKGDQPPKGWNCHSECKVIMDTEVAAIIHLSQASMNEVRSALYTCDDRCPNQHYTRVVRRDDLGWDVIQLQGHSLVCSMMGNVAVSFASSEWHPPTIVC